MANHTNQVVLITGGASGIGKATAMKLAAKGVTVVITGRREDVGAVAVKEIERVARDGAQVRFIRNDVTGESAAKGLIDGIASASTSSSRVIASARISGSERPRMFPAMEECPEAGSSAAIIDTDLNMAV